MPGLDPEQIAKQRIDGAVAAATEPLKKEVEYWKGIATERLLSFVKTVRPVGEDDIVIFTIPVGNMPAHEISDYVKQFAEAMEDARTDGGFKPFETFWLPRRADGVGPTMEILSPNEGDILVVKIPIGNLPASEADAYLADIKAQFVINNKKIGDILWIPIRGGAKDPSMELELKSEDRD